MGSTVGVDCVLFPKLLLCVGDRKCDSVVPLTAFSGWQEGFKSKTEFFVFLLSF